MSEERREFTVKVYIWLPANCCTIPCPECSDQGCKCNVEGNYGHAALSIPYCNEVSKLLTNHTGKIKEYPLYLSLMPGTSFSNPANDLKIYENYHAYLIPLSCTEKEIIMLWEAFLKKQISGIKGNLFFDVAGCNVPRSKIDGKRVYDISFSACVNSSSDKDNCTTFVRDLLKEAKMKGFKYRCSKNGRVISTVILQTLNSVFMGYNTAVAVEICEICLPEQAKPIRVGVAICGVIMLVALGIEYCCLPFSRQRCYGAVKNITQYLRTPLSMLVILPVLLVNFAALIYIGVFHSQNHKLFDNASWLGFGIGAVVGVFLAALSALRTLHIDTLHFITRPEALLDFYPDQVKELNSKTLFIEAAKQDSSVTEAAKPASQLIDNVDSEIIVVEESVKRSKTQDTVHWDGYASVFSKSSKTLVDLDSSEEEADNVDEDSTAESLQFINEGSKVNYLPT